MLKRTLLPLVTAAAVTMSLVVAGCSQSDAAGTEASTTLPIYTPSEGSGDPVTSGADSVSADGSTGMTEFSASSDAASTATTASGPGSASDTATTGAAATGKTITVMPTRATKTLASSLVVSMTVAPGVDTSGIDIEGAKNAYGALVKLSDMAVSNPTRDWSDDFAALAVDPALSMLMHDLDLLNADGVRIIGHSSFTATITSAQKNSLLLKVCLDNRGQDIIDASGKSVKSGGGLHPQTVHVARSGNGVWRISEVQGEPQSSC